jgi:acetyl-CoA carboxylase biotin carboxyl carrier protein
MSSELTHEDVQRILKIIDEAKHLEELELVYGGFRLHIRRHGAPEGAPRAPAALEPPEPTAQAAPAAQPAPKGEERPVPPGMVAIRAPMLGTFYRAPSPGEPPFVEAGQKVKADDTVCLIEVMKLFNSIKAGTDGTVAEIRAQNAALVEYNEVLIVIDPDGR